MAKQTTPRFQSKPEFTPGPGAYSSDQYHTIARSPVTVHSPFVAERRSTRPRGADVPGPGAYSPQSGSVGKVVHGSYKSTDRRFREKADVTPGPGQYYHSPSWRPRSAKSTMGSQPRFQSAEWTRQSDSPGPGQYSPTTGRLRRPQSAKAASFNTTSPRFVSHNEMSPGPGAYHHDRKVQKARKPYMIGSSPRDTQIGRVGSASPGPGAYFM